MTPWLKALTIATLVALPLGITLSCGEGGIVGGECIAGLTACGRQCVNLGSDPENCGSCGLVCEGDEECLVGVCIRRRGAVPTSNLDGGVVLPDGAVLLPDGAVVRPDGAPLGNGGSAGNGGGGNGGSAGNGGGGNGGSGPLDCVAPFNTGEQCGDCETACASPFPLCSPVGGTFECTLDCADGLLPCGDRCVDPTTDPDHCGGCGRRCPTAICRNSTCVGATPGHVVAMCMSLEEYRTDAPQNRLLGNSVFLAPSDPVRVLAYSEGATDRVVAGVQLAITDADDRNSRSIELSPVTTTSNDVLDALTQGTHDVLLVYDQELATPGSLAALGQQWRDALTTFTAAGGIVIVLASTNGAAEMADLLTEGGLLVGLTGLTDATGSLLYNRAPSDSVGLRVYGEFAALRSSCLFEMNATAPIGTAYVITDTVGGAGAAIGTPSVIHSVSQ